MRKPFRLRALAQFRLPDQCQNEPHFSRGPKSNHPGRSVAPASSPNATRISHPFGPTHTCETAPTERALAWSERVRSLDASDGIEAAEDSPSPGPACRTGRGDGRLPLPWARERVAEGRVRDQRGNLTAAAEGGPDLFPQGLDSAFPKREENCSARSEVSNVLANRFQAEPVSAQNHPQLARREPPIKANQV